MYLPLYVVVFIVSGSDGTRVQFCLVCWHFSQIVFLHVWAARSSFAAPVINRFEWNSEPCNIKMYLVFPAVTTAVAKSTGRGSLQTINFKFLNQIISLCLHTVCLSCLFVFHLLAVNCIRALVLLLFVMRGLLWLSLPSLTVFWPHVLLSESRSLCAVWQLIPPRPLWKKN